MSQRVVPVPRTWPLVVSLILVGCPITAHAQTTQPPLEQSQATKTTSAEDETVTIVGRVTMADTGAPVRRERCQVVASKAPFVTMRHGQRYPNGPATDVDLTSASSASRMDIALWRGGVIAGRVYDDLGEPAAYTQVVALRVRVRGGQRTFVPTGRAGTADDLGRYRLAGLPTGSYIVATVPARDGYRLAPSYYPGTQNAAAATRVPVTAGGERSGVDFELGFAPTARVRGAVLDSQGRQVSECVVVVFSDDASRWGASSRFVETASLDQGGSFCVRNLPPGTHRAVALEFLEEGAEEDPELLTALRADALKFDLRKGESLKLSLPLTRVK